MRAIAVFPKERAVRLIDDHPEPRIESPTQVKIRMLEVGVCGTDHEVVSFQYGTPPPGEKYLVLGHESLGQVIDVGDRVSRVHPGDLVVVMVRRPCPHPDCRACRAGRQDFCYTGDYLERGIKQRHGFMTEYVVDDEKYLHPAPAELREFAVLTEPLTVAEKAMIQVWGVQERLPWECQVAPGGEVMPRAYCHTAVVLGAGPVGLLGAMLIRKSGFQAVVYSREDPDGSRAKIVEEIGAQYVSAAHESPADLERRLGNIDLVYEATGASRMAFDFLEHLGTNGVYIFTGVPGRREQAPLPTGTLMRDMVLKNQLIFGSVNAGPHAYGEAIKDVGDFSRRWPEALAALITRRFDMEDFEAALVNPEPGIKRVISIWETEEE